MTKTNKVQYIAGIVIFVIIVILINIKRERNYNRPISLEDFQTVSVLPEFQVLNIYGEEVTNTDFKGENIYTQFIDPSDYDDIKLIKEVYSKWKNEDITIIAFINDTKSFRKKFGMDFVDMVAVENLYEKMKSIFKSPDGVGTYYLFDNNGLLAASGKNRIGYEYGPKIQLKRLINKDFFQISDFIPEKGDIRNIEWFKEINELFNYDESNFHILSFFTSICNTCASGKIVNRLDEIYSTKHDSIQVLGILHNKFKMNDIKSLTSQLKARFPFVIAGPILSEKWNDLISEFNESYLNEVIIIIDNKGEILNIYHRNCNCGGSFFRFIDSLKNSGKTL